MKIFVFPFLFLALSVGAETASTEFGNDGLSLVFAGADDGFSLKSIVNRKGGETRFVSCPPGTAGLWRPQYSAVWKMPDVFGSIWQDIDRKTTAVVAANAADAPRTVRFKAPAQGLAVQSLDGFAAAAAEERGGIVLLTIPARGFAFLKTP